MENVILSDEKIDIIRNKVREEADPYSITNESIDYNDLLDKELIKAQARHLLRILKEPCVHLLPDIENNNMTFLGNRVKYSHRYLCPECMEQIEKEIER
jgi:hypothetical protein